MSQMPNEMKNLFLLTSQDLKRIRKLTRHLDRALQELIQIKRITTFDDLRESYPPHQSDLAEEASFIEQQLAFWMKKENQEL
jgi:hypothetical protein